MSTRQKRMCFYSTFRERVFKVSWGHFCSFRIELQFSFGRISFRRLKTSHIGFYSSTTQLSSFMTSLFLFLVFPPHVWYVTTLICYCKRSLKSLSPLQDIYFLLLICDIEAEENCAFWVNSFIPRRHQGLWCFHRAWWTIGIRRALQQYTPLF